MKIVHALGWYFPDALGGTEIYVAGVCRLLRAAGHEVWVAAPDPSRTTALTYEHDAVPVFRYPIPSQPTRAEAQGLTAVRGAEQFHDWLSHIRPDVLHVHSFVTGLGLPEMRAAKRIGARVMVTHHLPALGFICRTGSLMQCGREPCDGVAAPRKCGACSLFTRGLPISVARTAAAVPPSVGRLFGRLPGKIGTVLGMSASIVTDSAHQAELMALADQQVVLNEAARTIIAANGWPVDRVMVNRLGTRHGAVLRKPSPSIAPTRSPVRVVYLGRFDRRKGICEIVHATRQLPESARLTVDIRGPVTSQTEQALLGELRHIARSDPRIRFEPQVDPELVPEVLASYDLLCCPSTGFENGPTVALDAYAVGTPVIGTRVGNLPELIVDRVNGRLLPPGDIDALTRALDEVAKHPDLTIDVWRANVPVVRTLDQVAADYLAWYSNDVPSKLAG